jgi:hypothetical protein
MSIGLEGSGQMELRARRGQWKSCEVVDEFLGWYVKIIRTAY